MPTTTTPAETEHFLGSTPTPASQWIGRITHLNHNPRHTWTEGHLTLPTGTHIPFIAHTHTVGQHLHLLQPAVRVIVTGHELGGPLYLTRIRTATSSEWADARTTPAHQPAA